jgi:hypothetical protein
MMRTPSPCLHTTEPENILGVPEPVCCPSRAYKLGKQRWSYNQCELNMSIPGMGAIYVAEATQQQQQQQSRETEVRGFALLDRDYFC